MFREWKALFLEGLPIYEDEVVYLTFYSLNSSFNDREQSQVLFWCCVLFVRIACAQLHPSYSGCRRLFMRGFRFRSSLNHDPREIYANLCKLFGNSIYSGATQTSLSLILFEERVGCT